jgi:hypothetical protein
MKLLNAIVNNPSVSKCMYVNSFDTKYHIKTANCLAMGKQNPEIKMETEAIILFSQDVDILKITNTLETISIEGNTDNEMMNPHLQQLLLLTDISKRIVIERNSHGKLKAIANVSTLRKDFEKWKAKKISDVFQTRQQQQTFIKNYEKGLDSLNKELEKNFQYILLMPEVYHFKKERSGQLSNRTSQAVLLSKLVGDMVINYHLKSTVVKEDGQDVTLRIVSEIENEHLLVKRHLSPMYEKYKEYSLSDYQFKIQADYLFEKESSKIKNATFSLYEQLHAHLSYKLEIRVQETA